jgi:hypothetical protein
MIEMVERGERRAFHDIGELWAILAGTAGKVKGGSGQPE